MSRPLNVARIISMMTVGGVQGMLLSTLPHFDKSRFNIRVCCTDRIGKVGRALQQQGVSVDLCLRDQSGRDGCIAGHGPHRQPARGEDSLQAGAAAVA